MSTRLQAWATGWMEGAVLLAAATVPVMVNYYAFSPFEPAKRGLMVTFAAVALGFAVVALIEGGGRAALTALRRPLPAAAVLLLAATGVSAAASVVPRLSLLGSLERSMGWITLAAALALFTAAAAAGGIPRAAGASWRPSSAAASRWRPTR